MTVLAPERTPASADLVAFVHEAPRLSTAAILAIRGGDPDAVVSAAHKLATMSTRVGAVQLADIASTLERAASCGRLGVLRDGHGLGPAMASALRTCRARLQAQG